MLLVYLSTRIKTKMIKPKLRFSTSPTPISSHALSSDFLPSALLRSKVRVVQIIFGIFPFSNCFLFCH